VNTHYDPGCRTLPWSRRIQISDHRRGSVQRDSNAGPTLRYECWAGTDAERRHASGKRVHLGVLAPDHYPISWWHLKPWVVVMTPPALQCTRKVIEWLDSHGAGQFRRARLRGLAVMARWLDEGVDCAFTIDGPRGPRYVAKPGPCC